MRHNELREFSPTPGLETRTPKAREPSPPYATPFKWAYRTWEPRRSKEPSESELSFSCEKNGTLTMLAHRGLSSIALPNPSCH